MKLNKEGIQLWWSALPAGKKTQYKIVGGIVSVVLLAWVTTGESTTRPRVTKQQTETAIFGNDQKQLDMAHIKGELDSARKEREGDKRRLDSIDLQLKALTETLGDFKEISDTKAWRDQLSARLDKMEAQIAVGGGPSTVADWSSAQREQQATPLGSATVNDVFSSVSAIPGASSTAAGLSTDAAGSVPAAGETSPTPRGTNSPLQTSREHKKINYGSGPEAQHEVGETRGDGSNLTLRSSKGQRGPRTIKIPLGTQVYGVMLAGADVPATGEGFSAELPVYIRVTEIGNGPNKFTLDMIDCFIQGQATGELQSERIHIRSTNLSCVTEQGETLNKSMPGNVYGQDGKLGVRGRLVHKAGQLLARSIVPGILGGIGEAATPRGSLLVTNTSEGGDEVQMPDVSDSIQAGAARGVGNSLQEVADYFMKWADKMFPVLELDALRPVTVIVQSEVVLGEATE